MKKINGSTGDYQLKTRVWKVIKKYVSLGTVSKFKHVSDNNNWKRMNEKS